ncbi:hypothetical protein [Dehalobacter sp. TBBPA1]
MKINRLLEMIILLLNKGTITAGELSDRFQCGRFTGILIFYPRPGFRW